MELSVVVDLEEAQEEECRRIVNEVAQLLEELDSVLKDDENPSFVNDIINLVFLLGNRIESFADCVKSREALCALIKCMTNVQTNTNDVAIKAKINNLNLLCRKLRDQSFENFLRYVRTRFVDLKYMTETFFTGCVTEDSVNRHLRKLSLHLHPDRISSSRLRLLAQEVFVQVQQTAKSLTESFTSHSDDDQNLLKNLIDEGHVVRKMALRHKTVAKSKEQGTAVDISHQELAALTVDQLKSKQKILALTASKYYRSAIQLADKLASTKPSDYIEKQISLRQFMAICYHLAGHKVEAQLYILAALHIASFSVLSDNELAKTLNELEQFLRKICQSTVENNGPTPPHPPPDSNQLVAVLNNTALRQRPREFRAKVKTALASNNQWIVAQGIRPDGAVARFECSEEEIMKAEANAITYYTASTLVGGVGGVAVLLPVTLLGVAAAETIGVVGLGTSALLIAAAGGPIAIAVTSIGFIACTLFGWKLLGTANNLAQEPKRRKLLNSIIKRAFSLYNEGNEVQAIQVLSERFVDQNLLVLTEEKLELDPKAIVTNLLARGLRADGIAYILNMIADILISGKLQFKNLTQLDLNSKAREIYLELCDNVELAKNADDLDRRVFETRTEVGRQSFQWFQRRMLAAVEGVPESYFEDAQEAPFFVRLTEMRNIARMNLAILYVLERHESANVGRAQAMLREVHKSVHGNFQYFSVNENRLEALEDFLFALGVPLHDTCDTDLLAVMPPEFDGPHLRFGAHDVRCFDVVNISSTMTLGELFDKLFDPDPSGLAWSNELIVLKIKEFVEQRDISANTDAEGYPNDDPETELHKQFIALLEDNPKFLASNVRLCHYFKVLTDTFDHIVWSICSSQNQPDRLYTVAAEYNAIGYPGHNCPTVDRSTIFLSLNNDKTYPLFLTAFRAEIPQTSLSYRTINSIQHGRDCLAKARITNGVKSVQDYSAAFRKFQSSLNQISFSWKVLWQAAKIANIYQFHYETKLMNAVVPHSVTKEEVECVAGMLECLTRMGKYRPVLGLMLKLRDSTGLSNDDKIWYWYAVAARKARLYFDASYAIQQSLRVNLGNADAIKERQIIMNMRANKITIPAYDCINQKVQYTVRYNTETTTRRSNTENAYFDILSIDGGGIRGIIPAYILADIEKRTHRPIHSLVHMQAGTSTGAIIAAALSTPHRLRRESQRPLLAADLVRLYANPQNHQQIFARSLSLYGLFGSKYLDKREYVLSDVLGNAKLSDSLNDLLIVAVDKRNQLSSHCFNTFDARGSPAQHDVWLIDALMASSAAPTFFPSYEIGETQYVDGGVQANNPAHLAVTAAMRNGKHHQNIRVWSLGTGDLVPDPDVESSQETNYGALYWISRAHATAMAGQQGNVDSHLSTLLSDRYHRWQVWLDTCYSLDDYQENAIAALVENAMQFVEENDERLTACANALLVNRGYDPIN